MPKVVMKISRAIEYPILVILSILIIGIVTIVLYLIARGYIQAG